MADEREQRFTRAERAALYAVFEHGDARPWERGIVAKCGGLAAWRALKVEARNATSTTTQEDEPMTRPTHPQTSTAIPNEAIDKGRSVRSWLQPHQVTCKGCLGTGFGTDTNFDETCVHCNGEGSCTPASEGA